MIKRLALLFIPLCLFGQSHPPIELSKIEDSVWVHTTWRIVGDYDVPSNGLIIVTGSGLLLVDTPWDDSLTAALLANTLERFKQSVALAIITHAHDDRIGGIRTLRKLGIKVVSLPLTCQKAKELGYPEPEPLPAADTTLMVGGKSIELFYPGPGHTVDNSVVWLPEYRILFGGCMVKSKSSANLGNVADADLKEWPSSIQKTMDKFPSARVVIPGHGEWGDFSLLKHTLDLLRMK